MLFVRPENDTDFGTYECHEGVSNTSCSISLRSRQGKTSQQLNMFRTKNSRLLCIQRSWQVLWGAQTRGKAAWGMEQPPRSLATSKRSNRAVSPCFLSSLAARSEKRRLYSQATLSSLPNKSTSYTGSFLCFLA